MKKLFSKHIILTATTVAYLNLFATKIFAQLTNPAIEGTLGSDAEAAASGSSFAVIFIALWNVVISIGALMVIVFLLWGAIEWITAGGDSSKVEKARNKIMQSIIGLVILVSSIVIIGFISQLLFGDSFNILNLSFTTLPGGVSE